MQNILFFRFAALWILFLFDFVMFCSILYESAMDKSVSIASKRERMSWCRAKYVLLSVKIVDEWNWRKEMRNWRINKSKTSIFFHIIRYYCIYFCISHKTFKRCRLTWFGFNLNIESPAQTDQHGKIDDVAVCSQFLHTHTHTNANLLNSKCCLYYIRIYFCSVLFITQSIL